MTVAIILAGGLGKRMNSIVPKVLHKLGSFPMLAFVIVNALAIGSCKILIVVGKYKALIEDEISQLFDESVLAKIHYIIQPEKVENGVIKVMGTGDAIKCCLPYFINNAIDLSTQVIILSGDVPLITTNTIKNLLSIKNSIIITDSINPTGCGRIFFNDDSDTKKISKIVEEKDCTPEERKCTIINCGIYNVTVDTLLKCIPLIQNNNANQEYYLTDLIEIGICKNIDFLFYTLPSINQHEIININTPSDLFTAELYLQN